MNAAFVIISSILFSLTIINHNLYTINILSLQNYILFLTKIKTFRYLFGNNIAVGTKLGNNIEIDINYDNMNEP